MTARRDLRFVSAMLVLAALAACGKRGNPLPPLRPMPARITDATARRIGDRIELRFTVPAANLDNSTPPVVTRLDIYAAPGPPSAPAPAVFPPASIPLPVPSRPIAVTAFPRSPIWTAPPTAPVQTSTRPGRGPVLTAQQLLNASYRRGRLDVRPPQPPPDPNAPAAAPATAPAPAPSSAVPADNRPAPGEAVTFTEDVAKERGAAEASTEVSVLRYIVVPVAGNRPGPASNLLEVPLRATAAPPRDPVVTYDERNMRIAWTAAEASQSFRVYRSDAAGKEVMPSLNATPLATREFTTPVEFGVERCFVIHGVIARGSVSVESEPTAAVCKAAVDTFAPAAPDGLIALPSEGKVQLKWNAVDAADLAGYVVLRGEDSAANLQPLTASPITDAAYEDTTTKAGVRYFYAVVAVDKAGNRSTPSNVVEEVGRQGSGPFAKAGRTL